MHIEYSIFFQNLQFVFSLIYSLLHLFHNGISSFDIDKMVDDGRVWLQADVKMLVVSVVDSETWHKAINHELLCCEKAAWS